VRTRSVFPEFERLHEQMEQMWRRVMEGSGGRFRFCSPVLTPPTDVLETPTEVVIVAEIAGIEGQEVEIRVEDDRLTFRGEKSDRQARPERRYARMEICYGLFERTLLLPARVDSDKIDVSYAGGFLRIALPKAEKSRREVRVTVRRLGDDAKDR